MKAFLNVDVIEATRLTRQGRLDEAVALLRGARPLQKPAADRHEPAEDATLIDMAPLSGASNSWTSKFNDQPTAPLNRSVNKPPFHEPLSGIVGRLGKLGSMRGVPGFCGSGSRPAVPLPHVAQFVDRSYANEAGQRAYKLYVPSTYDGQSTPLVVMLHGCTQSPADFAAGTRMNELAEEQRFLVAYPSQDQSANPSKCWNWFNVGDQQRGRGEPSLIAGITLEIIGEFPVDAARVYIAGLSAGGAAAAIMGSAYPDLYAAIGVHSGLACGAASDMPSAFAAMRHGSSTSVTCPRGRTGARQLPTIVFHGDSDRTVSPINGEHVIGQAKANADLRTTLRRGVAAGGIEFTCTVHADNEGLGILEHWVLHGVGHAWSGGSAAGSYTEPRGPDASREMLRFFLDHRLA